MIELINIPEPERWSRYYVMSYDDEGIPTYLGAASCGWYRNPVDAKEHYGIPQAKGARTRYLKQADHWAEYWAANLRKDVEIVKIVVDSYHLERIC